MKTLRNSIKTTTLFLFFVIHRCVRLFRKEVEVAVLMYHSVENSNWKYGISPETFERQIAYLVEKGFNLVSLHDIVEYVYGKKKLPHRSVALTFDDGYEDTYSAVFPIIKRYGIPITVFLTTNLSSMEKLGNLPRITPAQIKEMAASGLVNFEVHGHDHANLSSISNNAELLKKELLTCKDEIQRLAGQNSTYMAYAAGHKDAVVIDFLKQHDFVAACAITEGLVRVGDDPFAIKRIQVDRTMNMAVFKMRLTGAVDLNKKFVRMVRKTIGRKV